jgi:hypothetical protein
VTAAPGTWFSQKKAEWQLSAKESRMAPSPMTALDLSALEADTQELDAEFLRLAGRFAEAANRLKLGLPTWQS